ncbi:MAG TPA: glycosyltransferase family 39 protein [Acidobacteriaceae bacterium]|nr:glycosyltransferase family 39 protein [Acidobacteriaceae bacterium]
MRTETVILWGIAAAVTLAHLLTNQRYGFHRDELQFLTDARHMDWGFVAYPPLTPFLERIQMNLFGLSMDGLRLFSVIGQAVTIVVTGLMARELGGGRLAQVTAVVCMAFAPVPLFNGTEFQYTSFDFLWWVLIAYCVIRLLRSENPRWWLAIGLVTGLGLMTKYAIVFFLAGLLGGFLLTPARRYFASWYFLAGSAIALAIFLPNLIWLVRHDFISYHFLQSIHARDVGEGRAEGFLSGQFMICTNPAAAPLWIGGLVAFFLNRRYRAMAWMYLIPLALFFFGKGRHYYMADGYPALLAMGAVAGERWVASLNRAWRWSVEGIFFTAIAFCGLYIAAIILPFASSGPLMRFALKNNGDLREEIGWQEELATIQGILDALPADQREHTGIFTGNYGEAGAVELLGPAYHLPPPISTTNSAWLRGYPIPPPTTLIVLGHSQKGADRAFTNCKVAGRVRNSLGVDNEESSDHPDIFLCGPPRLPWPEFWKTHQRFG